MQHGGATMDTITEFTRRRQSGIIGGALLVGVCFAAHAAPKAFQFWPPQDMTIAWLCALYFPVTAALFLIFSLQVRLDEVREEAERRQLDHVFFPDRPDHASAFHALLRQRFAEYYGELALVCFSLLAAVLTFTVAAILVVYWRPLNEGRVGETLPVVAPFAGALAGAFVLMARRFRTFDLYPSSYLQTGVALIAGTLAGAFLAPLWPALGSPLGFACAFLTTTNVAFLPRLLRAQFARATGTPMTEEIASDLDAVMRNSEAIDSIKAIAIQSVSELVKTDPLRLYLNTAQPIPVIDGWIDEALVHYYFGEQITSLRQAGVRRFTQLLEMTAEFSSHGMRWVPGAKVIGEATADEHIARTIASIVRSHDHHRLLGILSENYRKAFFVAPAQPVQAVAVMRRS